MAFDNNKIVSLSNEAEGLLYKTAYKGGIGGNGLNDVTTQILQEGESIGLFYGYKVKEVVNNKLVYEDITPDGVIDEQDKTIVGKAQPLFTFGWNNTIRYKWFDLTIFFRGMVGNDVLNVTRWAYTPSESGVQASMVYKQTAEAIVNGDGAYRDGVFSDYWLEDGSFLKCDNITLGCNVPLKPNKYVKNLRIYVTGQNLFTITSYSGLDPEVSISSINDSGIKYVGFYPTVSSYLLGLNVTF